MTMAAIATVDNDTVTENLFWYGAQPENKHILFFLSLAHVYALEEKTQNLATCVFTPRFFVIHDAVWSRQDDVSELH